MSRDPYNKVGKFILDECAENKVTYAFACANKEHLRRTKLWPNCYYNFHSANVISFDHSTNVIKVDHA